MIDVLGLLQLTSTLTSSKPKTPLLSNDWKRKRSNRRRCQRQASRMAATRCVKGMFWGITILSSIALSLCLLSRHKITHNCTYVVSKFIRVSGTARCRNHHFRTRAPIRTRRRRRRQRQQRHRTTRRTSTTRRRRISSTTPSTRRRHRRRRPRRCTTVRVCRPATRR